MPEKPLTIKELVEQITKGIQSKSLIDSNGKLPSEKELMHSFSVSRYAVRQALSQLGERGTIYQTHGVGSFVRQDDSLQASKLRNNIGLRDELLDVQLDLETVTASQKGLTAAEAEFLPTNYQLAPETPLIEVIRYRSLDGKPYQVEKSYYLKSLIQRIPEQELFHSIFAYVEMSVGTKIGFIDKVIRCDLLEEKQATFFGLDSGDPALVERDDTYLSSGKLLAFSKICYDYRQAELYLSKKIY